MKNTCVLKRERFRFYPRRRYKKVERGRALDRVVESKLCTMEGRSLAINPGKMLHVGVCAFALLLLEIFHTAIESCIGFPRHRGTGIVDDNDGTKAHGLRSQHLGISKQGCVRILTLCVSKERHWRDVWYR